MSILKTTLIPAPFELLDSENQETALVKYNDSLKLKHHFEYHSCIKECVISTLLHKTIHNRTGYTAATVEHNTM